MYIVHALIWRILLCQYIYSFQQKKTKENKIKTRENQYSPAALHIIIQY